MLTLNSVSFTLPDGRRLLDKITFSLRNEKAALIGDNGVGKSTLLAIAAGEIQASGSVTSADRPYFIPQFPDVSGGVTIAGALRVETKLRALQNIFNGEATDSDFASAGDDWSLEDRIDKSLAYWELNGLDLQTPLSTLSGGQQRKAYLAGLIVHEPALIILDEPTNHLDHSSRQLLYNFVAETSSTMLVTSHDRALLNRLDPVLELSRHGIARYGGNYDFYFSQRQSELEALHHDVQNQEKILRKAKERERETIQRQQKLDSRGKGKQEKAGLPTILQHAFKNSAERSTAKIKDVHASRINNITADLRALREQLPDAGKMKLDIDHSNLHAGKELFKAESINFFYENALWLEDLSFTLVSGERVALQGRNGSGKTTLANIILGLLEPTRGIVKRTLSNTLYIDQAYSLIDDDVTVTQQANAFNSTHLVEHEINIRLNRFLFPKDTWPKSCRVLSGGERMRLTLCCLSIAHASPDVIVLDEPTNNLDLPSVGILTAAINEYKGTLIVISHDEYFLRAINIQRTMVLHSHRPS
jgi:ATPase subunit of ABC transporter with duplicated ATPase domains